MVDETEVIREQMEATRSDLSDKLEQLENQVVNTVQEATSTVADAVQGAKDVVETVKDTVEGAVESVQGTVENVTGAVGGAMEGVRDTFAWTADCIRQTFDLPKQVDRHPWLMMGGAAAAGFAAGKLLDRAPQAARALGRAAQAGGRVAESAASAASGLWTTLENSFGAEIHKVKELALGALLGAVRDVVAQAAPSSMSNPIGDIIDSFTSKLGGKPVEGPVLGPRPAQEETSDGPRRRF
jgi:ElaB/YqjD/DUF883 family membrane-anchored ribosome-binding protein